ncbi:MAG: PQQ-like beta-propeller repeat protein [Alistipes sp.]|nr:PQQ-like beta-propeller repeat protein [Alistipes sp.]
MRYTNNLFILIGTLILLASVRVGATAQTVQTNPSASKIEYVVEVKDTVTVATLANLADCYSNVPGIFTFRGSSRRDMPQSGTLKAKPTRIKSVWTFKTAFDGRETPYGTWGGGAGWTGQPLYVEWPDELVERQRKESPALTADFSKREIMVGSLAGYVYFIDYESGRASRRAHKSGNPIKGTISLDPRLNGNLYIGQGIPASQPFGAEVFNLFSHKRISMFGMDKRAWRRWGAYDPSAVVVDNFVLRLSENGTVYKLTTTEKEVKIHTTLRYRHRGSKAYGMESSPAVWGKYLYFCDNIGNVLCVDIETMQPVWHYDNRDDSDATIVVAEEADGVFLYTGSSVDKQGDSGYCRFVKLDAKTGKLVWENKIACHKMEFGEKKREGGMFSSPLLGRGNCEGLIFTNICGMGADKGTFVAIDRTTGKIVYRRALKFYSWSSPVALYTPDNEMYVFTGDVIGNVYLIEAESGKIVYTMRGGNNFESSPIVIDNCVVVGSRGREIHKFEIY